VTARLIDALSGAHLWAQALDYSLETASIAEIEQEIVGRVAATIADAFGAIPRALAKESLGRRADSLSDYDAVLRFHHHIRTLTEASSDEAIWPVYNVHWNIG
jgi:hypothetical protein